MKVRVLTLVACAALMAGCAATYQEPTQANAATLTVRNADDFTSQTALYGGAAECTDRHLLPVVDGVTPVSRKVVPDAPLSFSMTYQKNLLVAVIGCTETLTFTPQAAHHYSALFSMKDNRCRIALTDLGTSAAPLATPAPVNAIVHAWKRAVTEQGPFCGS